MLFTEFNLEDAREVWEEEAREDGRAEGRNYTLIEQVTKKLKKGKTPHRIAEELEAEEEEIQTICMAAQSFAPDYDTEAIFKVLKKKM